jgi:hypothetical protein
MADKRIEVASYSGGKGEESPRSFVLDGEKIEVLSLVRTWIEESYENRKRKRFFMVRGSDGYTHTLFYEEDSSKWGISLP